jgi:hypothetical protein
LKSVIADNDHIQCLGRNFGYVMPTWKTIQSEGYTSWLSAIGGNLELECFEQLIALSLEFGFLGANYLFSM